MAEIYIRTDPDTKIVTFVHRQPFDPIHGLGQTREELLKTGFFVNEFPSPNSTPGLRAVAYYDHENKKINFEYQPLPFSEKTRLDMLESVVTKILTLYPSIIDKVLEDDINFVKSFADDSEDREKCNNELNSRRKNNMTGFSEYLAYQIHMGAMSKDEVLELYPYLEDDINSYLNEWDVVPEVPFDDPDDLDE